MRAIRPAWLLAASPLVTLVTGSLRNHDDDDAATPQLQLNAFEENQDNNIWLNRNTSKTIHHPGWCAFGAGGSCGTKSLMPLPCAQQSPARPITESLRLSLESICGITNYTHSCCNEDSLSRLSDSLKQASAFIALCPACSDSFKKYYCEFTCSPNQSTFVNITSTQNLTGGDIKGPAVKSLEFYVNPSFGKAFFNACKDVKFAATNGYAMEFIGGNAKNWLEFLRYMGKERPGLGSPFQIDFPQLEDDDDDSNKDDGQNNATVPIPEGIIPLNLPKLDCADSCACADCPSRCLSLPPLPDTSSHCHIGALTCGSFFLILAYSILLLSFILGIGIRDLWARRHTLFGKGSTGFGGSGHSNKQQGRIYLTSSPGEYDRLDLGDSIGENASIEDDAGEEGLNMLPTSSHEGHNTLSNTASIDPSSSRWRRRLSNFMSGRNQNDSLSNENHQARQQHHQRSETSSTNTAIRSSSTNTTGGGNNLRSGGGDSESNSQQRLGRGASLLSSDILTAYSQPRTYKLNNILSTIFYKLGLICSKNPYITILIGLSFCGILNSGWSKFKIEKDPVRLWVEKGSELELQKTIFEENFGPFYRTEQIFISRLQSSLKTKKENDNNKDDKEIKPILDWETINWWASIESEIRDLISPSGTRLSEICFAPTSLEDDRSKRKSEDCTIQSFMGYFKDDLNGINEDNWKNELNYCVKTPTACLSSAGQPLNPKLLFGGPSVSSSTLDREDQDTDRQSTIITNVDAVQTEDFKASEAEAIVITYVLDNSLDSTKVQKASEWEKTLKEYLSNLSDKAATERGIRISFSTEISLEEELNKSTNTDVPIVVLSYLVMFFYVSLSLGGTGEGIVFLIWALLVRAFTSLARLVKRKTSSTGPISLGSDDLSGDMSYTASSSKISISSALRTIFVDSKFTLGLVGIAIVLLSVSTSVGLFSFFGVKVTLIIAEVIPFLVLAIGVDNVFILLHELQRQNSRAYSNIRTYTSQLPPATMNFFGTTVNEWAEEIQQENSLDTDEDLDLSDLPPVEERIAKSLGRMGPSILLSSTCQIFTFSLGAIVGMPAVRNFAIYAAGAVAINALLQITVFIAFMTLDLKRIESSRVDCFPCLKITKGRARSFAVRESIVVRFIRSVFAPFLLKRKVKYAVMAIFSGLFVASWICTDYIDLGLDQRLALPRKSYLVEYFNDLDSYLQVGPPVYFVEQGLDLTQREAQQQVCGRFSTCSDYSIGNILEAERKRSISSYIAEPPSIWLDDFFQWLNPALSSCCRIKKRDTNTFCKPEDSEFICKACYEEKEEKEGLIWNITMEGLPLGEEFIKYLNHWLESPANEECPLGGKAGYSSAISIDRKNNEQGIEEHRIKASHFRTYHTPLKKQNDYINALASAKRISSDLSEHTNGGKIFPYSIFYVYFEQYATIVTTTRAVLALALAAVLAVTSIILGSWRTGFVVVITVFMIAMNVLGIMGIWHISLNAISLVNLVISIGIGVEFCSHIARAFMGAGSGMNNSSVVGGGGAGLPHSHPAGEKERDDRSYAALIDVGSSVFSGITMTKLIGISVLALTKSKLLEIYYFRMWLTLIISGALHGLIFLPVALSFHGGQGFSLFGQEDEEYIAEIARYRGRPFYSGDDDEDEDDDSIASGDRF